MDEATKSAENIRFDIRELKNKYVNYIYEYINVINFR